ncbi:hypothetical protein [Tabrizicola sp.]|uniref:hypothetical protein n=1 Tax=Tabrizicola sp. TaxID=2005166 RepID=UPI003F39FA63
MPLCQWFGTVADHKALLEELFDWGVADVFEVSSRADLPLRRFDSPEAVVVEFDRPAHHGSHGRRLSLLLRVRDACPALIVYKHKVTSGSMAGSVIERIDDTGCLSLELEVFGKGHRLEYSSTNTSSTDRMGAENGLIRDTAGAVWNIGLCNRVSAAMNRRIRKRAVAKIGTLSVLPGAAALWQSGEQLFLYSMANDAKYFVTL